MAEVRQLVEVAAQVRIQQQLAATVPATATATRTTPSLLLQAPTRAAAVEVTRDNVLVQAGQEFEKICFCDDDED